MSYYERNREYRLAYQNDYALRTRERRYEWNREYYRKKKGEIGIKPIYNRWKNIKYLVPKRCPTCKRLNTIMYVKKNHLKRITVHYTDDEPEELESDFIMHFF